MHANMQYALQHVFNLNPVRAKLGVRVPSIFPVRLHPALRSSTRSLAPVHVMDFFFFLIIAIYSWFIPTY